MCVPLMSRTLYTKNRNGFAKNLIGVCLGPEPGFPPT